MINVKLISSANRKIKKICSYGYIYNWCVLGIEHNIYKKKVINDNKIR